MFLSFFQPTNPQHLKVKGKDGGRSAPLSNTAKMMFFDTKMKQLFKIHNKKTICKFYILHIYIYRFK